MSKTQQLYRLRKLEGKTRQLVDGERSRRIIRLLQSRGYSLSYIAQRIGVNKKYLGVVVRMDNPPSRKGQPKRGKNVSKTFEDSLERLVREKNPLRGDSYVPSMREGYVSSVRSMHILRGLGVQGYSGRDLEKRTGISQRQLSRIYSGTVGYILPKTEKILLDTLNEIGTVYGGNKTATKIALERGYVGIANWDDLL